MGWYKLENDTHTCTIMLACEHTNTRTYSHTGWEKEAGLDVWPTLS